MPTVSLIDAPYGPAVAGRGLGILRQVQEHAGVSWAAKDISAARWVYRVRAWDADTDTAFIYDAVLTKHASLSSTGWLDHYLSLTSTARDTLTWEIVECDSSNADATTSSGYRERVLERWRQPVIDAPL